MLMRLAIVCLVLGITADLRGQNKDIEKEIRSAYDAYYAAIRQRDVDGAMKFFTSDYTEHLRSGVVLDYAGEVESTKQLISAPTIGDTRVDLKELQDQGRDVTVTVREVFFYAGSPDAKPTSFADDLMRDTWTRTPQGWKLRKTVHLTDINGSLTPASVPPQSPRLHALLEDWNAGKKEALAAFWKGVEGKAPLVEEMKSEEKQGDRPMLLVTFLWRSDSVEEKVALAGGLPHEIPPPLTRLADTDVWYLTELMPADSRSTYAFRVEGFFTGSNEHFSAIATDPLNPNASAEGSYLELPNAPAQPYIKEIPGVPHGNLTRLTIKSTILNEERDYGVYTPAEYSTKDQHYNLLLLFDGEVWGNGADNLVPTPTILDNLVAQKKIPPTILVLVNAGSRRDRDLTCSQSFVDFLVKELLPEVRRSYRVTADPKHVVVGGSSLGGLASACAGLMHPEAFGNILSLSGAYWYIPGWEKMGGSFYLGDSGWVMRQYLQSPKLPLRFYIEVGRYEGLATQMPTNRNLRDILNLKGYPVTYSEFDGGHAYLCWRGSVADGLIALFGPGR